VSYVHYLCLVRYNGVQHILCCVFVCLRLVFPMLPVSLDCPFCLPLWYSLTFVLCLVFSTLPDSLDCPYLIAPLVFSNVSLPHLV
jgi:hypothetical protein